MFQAPCRQAWLACWVSVGNLGNIECLCNNSRRAVFPVGLFYELAGLGWELSSQEGFIFLSLVISLPDVL